MVWCRMGVDVVESFYANLIIIIVFDDVIVSVNVETFNEEIDLIFY